MMDKKESPFQSTSNRKNKRSLRSAAAPKQIQISSVKSTQTLQDLKLLIYQEVEIVPYRQNLYKREQGKNILLENDDLTLAQYEIKPDSVIVLEKKEESIEILEDVPIGGLEIEEGFKGTGLYSFSAPGDPSESDQSSDEKSQHNKWSCAHCTYLNIPEHVVCQICRRQEQQDPDANTESEQELQTNGKKKKN